MNNAAILENLEELILSEIKRLKLMDGASEADKLNKAKEIAELYRLKTAQESSDSSAEAELIKANAAMVKAKADEKLADATAEAELIRANAAKLEAEAEAKDKKRRRIIDTTLGVTRILTFVGTTLGTLVIGLSFEDDHYLSSKTFSEVRGKLLSKLSFKD